MDELLFDLKLREALERAELRDFQAELDAEDGEIQWSSRYLRQRRKLLLDPEKWRKRRVRPAWKKVLHAAACFLLVLLLAGCTVLAVSPEAREAFVGWTRQVFENVFEYRYTGEDARLPENTVYLPTWLPDDYEVYLDSYDSVEVKIIYSTEQGNLAYFLCYMNNEGTVFQNVGETEQYEVYVGEYLADLYIDKCEGENNALVWHDEERQALFGIFAPLSGDELIKIAESVEATEMVIPKE